MKATVAIVLGTRPEAIKLAPVVRLLDEHPRLQPLLIATGQHDELVNPILETFRLEPQVRLNLMTAGQSPAGFGARLIDTLEPVLAKRKPDFVLVQGDTGTAFFGGLAAFYQRVPVAHVEAGLRTYNLASPFPEEGNRAMLSRIAALHFAPTETSRQNLLREAVPEARIHVTGNTVIDALQLEIDQQQDREIAREIKASLDPWLGQDWQKQSLVLITGHRRENFGSGMQTICQAIRGLAERFPERLFVYPVHLNPSVQEPVRRLLDGLANVRLLPPLSYRRFIGLLAASQLVLTDSGGIQEEAPSLGKPVLVMRDTTERPEGVEAGTVQLVGANEDAIVMAATDLLINDEVYSRMQRRVNPYGDGQASKRIVAVLDACL